MSGQPAIPDWKEPMDLGAQLFDQLSDANRAAAEHMRIGREQGRREAKAATDALRDILNAWREDDVLPDRLLAALVAARGIA